LPESDPSGVGIIIFPGGGYGGLAAHEGAGYAQFLCSAGVACFVVKYRLGPEGHRHPAMLEDALAAIATVRSRAKEFAINPAKLGVMGSSAGGHLAAHSLVAWQQYESRVSLRPSFGILCYPVIVSHGPHAHQGSIRNLAGEKPSPELLHELSCDKHVCAETPPCFLWHTAEDTAVPLENSTLFAAALRKHSIPFELHLYHKGRHGLGLGAPFDWSKECLRWIEETAQPDVPLRLGQACA
jgi:acetyl esterase/lipase